MRKMLSTGLPLWSTPASPNKQFFPGNVPRLVSDEKQTGSLSKGVRRSVFFPGQTREKPAKGGSVLSLLLDELREKALSLPLTPGVYLMKDKNGKIIYIGKSRALKNRVSQYFREAGHTNVKTSLMVSHVASFEYILTDTENEALILENRLIKRHDPKYNIKLKDTSRDPYLRVTMHEDYPRIEQCWAIKKDGARYFGPYSSVSLAFAVKKSAEKLFRLPSCKRSFPRDFGKERPCLFYGIGQCCGVCTGSIDREEYRESVKNVLLYLNGNFAEIRKSLTEKMLLASEELRFEAAAVYRDRIEELGRLTERQKIISTPDTNADVIALFRGEPLSCLTLLCVRDGLLADTEHHLFTSDLPADSSSLSAFLIDLYLKKAEIPDSILLGEALEEEDETMLRDFLEAKKGRKVSLLLPEKGAKKSLCDMARENAERQTLLGRTEHERNDKTLVSLASKLALEVFPERIEAFDISNFGSDNITAGMVVFVNGKPKKSEYRLFRIRSAEKQDDYLSMREAVRRRMERFLDGDEKFSPLPDLLLLDGGNGHVSAVKDELISLGLGDIPLFGMVKDEFHKTRTLTDGGREIDIARDRAVFSLIYNVQEEVHNFTYHAMTKAKSESLRHSSLEKVKGIGPKKAASLLKAFGTLEKLRQATEDEWKAVKGISDADAENLAAYFHEKAEKKQ